MIRTSAQGARDAAFDLTAWGSAAFVAGAFAWLLLSVAMRGASSLSWSFLVSAPADAGRAGGIGPILVSTLWILLICMLVCGPLGLATAALLAEAGRADERFARWVRRCLDILAGTPSIVFGLFGSAFFCFTLGLGFSILSGGLTLACMVLPIFIRIAEQGLRAAPEAHRRSAAALGMSRTTTLLRVILPAALPAVLAGTVLGIGRALAESAALIFTSGYVDRMPASVFDSGRALAVHIYDLGANVPGGSDRAYAASLVLVATLLAINALTRFALGRLSGSLDRRTR